jgi:hypothetical protein
MGILISASSHDGLSVTADGLRIGDSDAPILIRSKNEIKLNLGADYTATILSADHSNNAREVSKYTSQELELFAGLVPTEIPKFINKSSIALTVGVTTLFQCLVLLGIMGFCGNKCKAWAIAQRDKELEESMAVHNINLSEKKSNKA